MSASDQAFIKAFAKDGPRAVPVPAAPASMQTSSVSPERGSVATAPRTRLEQPRAAEPAGLAPTVIENLYAQGSLYRIEQPRAVAVPEPHYAPPADATSRRTVRRPMSRYRSLLSDQGSVPEPEAEMPLELTRRQQVRSVLEEARRQNAPTTYRTEPAPSEIVLVEDQAEDSAKLATATAIVAERHPAKPVAPAVPMPERSTLADDYAGSSSQVILPSVQEIASGMQTNWMSVELESYAPISTPITNPLIDYITGPVAPPTGIESYNLAPPVLPTFLPLPVADAPPVSVTAAEQASLLQAPVAPSAAKQYRLDTPAGATLPTPHFGRKPTAEAVTEALDAAEMTIEPEPKVEAKAPPKVEKFSKKTCIPLWEVDRFLWPETCNKLLKDEKSYFMQAGSKLVAAAKDGLKTLAVTGSRRGEGRTTLALCLARCAAQSGIQVAVIDADFSRPQLATVIGLEVAYGWQDAALGKIPLAEAAVKSIADKITVLPLEVAAAAQSLSLADPRVTATFRAAAATFDLVIVDLGPLAQGDEPLFPAGEGSPFDAVIVLRDLRYATPTESQVVGERLYTAGVEAVGIAENFAPSDEA